MKQACRKITAILHSEVKMTLITDTLLIPQVTSKLNNQVINSLLAMCEECHDCEYCPFTEECKLLYERLPQRPTPHQVLDFAYSLAWLHIQLSHINKVRNYLCKIP